jgi:hypothetical protein
MPPANDSEGADPPARLTLSYIIAPLARSGQPPRCGDVVDMRPMCEHAARGVRRQRASIPTLRSDHSGFVRGKGMH